MKGLSEEKLARLQTEAQAEDNEREYEEYLLQGLLEAQAMDANGRTRLDRYKEV